MEPTHNLLGWGVSLATGAMGGSDQNHEYLWENHAVHPTGCKGQCNQRGPLKLTVPGL